MAITVEDGTGKSDADALISVAFALSFHAALGSAAWGSATTADQEAAIVRASQYISTSFNWAGRKKIGRGSADPAQALEWPRLDVWDSEGYYVESTSVPVEIQQATAIVALEELNSPGVMAPAFVPSGVQKSVKAGPVAVTYENSRTDARSSVPVLSTVTDLVSQFLSATGQGGRLSGRTVRAF